MNLTEGQTKPLWRLLSVAWAAHCKATGERVSDSAAKDQWRRALLRRETGFTSLTKVPRAGGAYVKFMAALEVIADDGSFYWLTQLHGAEERPYQHAIDDLIEQYDLANAYVEEIVMRVLGVSEVPSLAKMKVEQLGPILGALKRTCSYKLTREVAA